VFDLLSSEQKEHFYCHSLWQGVSCIRLKSGVIKEFSSSGEENESQSQTFLRAAMTICAIAHERSIWTSVRFSNNGYQSVLVYLGTRNIDQFMRLSRIRQQQQQQEPDQ
jgi:hypothetical protein